MPLRIGRDFKTFNDVWTTPAGNEHMDDSARTPTTSLPYCKAKSTAKTIAKTWLSSHCGIEAAPVKLDLTYVPNICYQIREPPE
jgi:hypothetical protein